MGKHRGLNQAKQTFLDYYLPLLPQFTSHTDLESYLTRRNPPVLLTSPLHESELRAMWTKAKYPWQPLDWFPHALFWPKDIPIDTPLPGFRQGWLYSLNPSSLLPVLALNPQPSDSILDACAAPGGKTLAIINLMSQISGLKITANDVSLPRFKRLRTVLTLFGYDFVTTSQLPIHSLKDKSLGKFDKILLDAPCSSEKHVFNSKQQIKTWSPKNIEKFSRLQFSLIESLLPLLAPLGTLVYSTCALSPAENEDVITAILNQHPDLRLIPSLTKTSPEDGDPMFVARLSRQHESPHLLHPRLP